MQYEILVSKISFSMDQDTNDYYGRPQGADEDLEAKVNQYIADGWRPQGGVSTVMLREDSQGDSKYTVIQQYQAMVKD